MEVSSEAEREASDRRAGLLHAVACLVFAYLPLSVQAITLPALSKAWKQWAQDQGAKERALEEVAKNDELEIPHPVRYNAWTRIAVNVPSWAVKQLYKLLPALSDERKRRLQLSTSRRSTGFEGVVSATTLATSRACARRRRAAVSSRC